MNINYYKNFLFFLYYNMDDRLSVIGLWVALFLFVVGVFFHFIPDLVDSTNLIYPLHNLRYIFFGLSGIIVVASTAVIVHTYYRNN